MYTVPRTPLPEGMRDAEILDFDPGTQEALLQMSNEGRKLVLRIFYAKDTDPLPQPQQPRILTTEEDLDLALDELGFID